MSQGLESRQLAALLMRQVLDDRQTVEEVREKSSAYSELSAQDKAFTMQLLMTSLRYRGALEKLLAKFLTKPMRKERRDVHFLLLTAMTQILLLEVPDHAVVNSAVELTKPLNPKLAGLVNAVLKQVITQRKSWWQQQNIAQLSTPEWLWLSWQQAYGEEAAQAIAQVQLEIPPLDITVKSEAEAWANKLEAELLPTGSLRRKSASARVETLPGFEEGAWWVQELAASLPVKLLGELSGKSVLDCCAAPGGKTAQLAAAGASVTAIDQSPHRVRRLQENMQRLHLQAEVITADLLSWEPETLYDIILLDAPCSATGTIRRHPELPWLRSPKDVKRLVQIQQKLLHRVSKWLRPGGVLLYAVCSLQAEEAEQQAENFLQTGKLTPDPITADEVAGQGDWITPQGYLRTLPGFLKAQGGMDGFFAARMRRPA
jgi:16S rRNA (cytosine967-C5)-methyltransferase